MKGDSRMASSAKVSTCTDDRNGQGTALLEQLMELGQPTVLTINGRAEFVVQDPASYKQLLELVDRLETIERVKKSMDAFDRGEGRPAREVLEELRQKHGIPS
jgi:hypothetical protein